MSRNMIYKGYQARIDFEAGDDCLVGRLAGIRDIVTFEADNVKDLHQAFHDAVDDYLETCKEMGKNPEKPFSGRVMLRISPEIHARMAVAAQIEGVSVNKWAECALDRSLGQTA